MIRRLWDIIAIVAVANLLAVLVLVGVLLAAGSLSGQRLRGARDALMGRTPAAAEAPATQPDGDMLNIVSAGQRIADDRLQIQRKKLQIDQQLRELKDFQLQLDQARAALETRIAGFHREKSAWQERQQNEQELLATEGFKKALALYQAMPADKAKDLFMTMEEADVVRFLSRMEERSAAKIVKAFETAAEKAKLKQILEVLENPASAKQDAPAAADARAEAPARKRP